MRRAWPAFHAKGAAGSAFGTNLYKPGHERRGGGVECAGFWFGLWRAL